MATPSPASLPGTSSSRRETIGAGASDPAPPPRPASAPLLSSGENCLARHQTTKISFQSCSPAPSRIDGFSLYPARVQLDVQGAAFRGTRRGRPSGATRAEDSSHRDASAAMDDAGRASHLFLLCRAVGSRGERPTVGTGRYVFATLRSRDTWRFYDRKSRPSDSWSARHSDVDRASASDRFRLTAAGRLASLNVGCCPELTLAACITGGQVNFGRRRSRLPIDRMSACTGVQ